VSTTASPEQILDQIRAYLLEGFSQVAIRHAAEAKMGTTMIRVSQGKVDRVVEVADAFLDPRAGAPQPVEALRQWDLIGRLKSVEAGSIVRVTTAGLREV
jgi:hypothetical protein